MGVVKYFYISVILCPFAVEGERKTEKTQKLRHPFRGWVLQRTLLRAVMYDQKAKAASRKTMAAQEV